MEQSEKREQANSKDPQNSKQKNRPRKDAELMPELLGAAELGKGRSNPNKNM
jgi:hypothetical protein